MTFSLSAVSERRLSTVAEPLRAIVYAVAADFPVMVVCGHRGQVEQDEAVRLGRSKTPWPKSKHNSSPSLAVDVAPVVMKDGKETIDWRNRERLAYFGGYVMRVAEELGLKVRWGGDWNANRDPKDDGWDMVHFELVSE
jgi:hypothetical protein